MAWTRAQAESLDGTYLIIVPDGTGAWIVVDSRRPGRSLGSALDKKGARKLAEARAATRKKRA